MVEDFSFDEIKTKNMVAALKNLNLYGEKTLAILPENDDVIFLSTRNIPGASVKTADTISTYDILSHKKLLIFKSAIDKIVKTFKN